MAWAQPWRLVSKSFRGREMSFLSGRNSVTWLIFNWICVSTLEPAKYLCFLYGQRMVPQGLRCVHGGVHVSGVIHGRTNCLQVARCILIRVHCSYKEAVAFLFLEFWHFIPLTAIINAHRQALPACSSHCENDYSRVKKKVPYIPWVV